MPIQPIDPQTLQNISGKSALTAATGFAQSMSQFGQSMRANKAAEMQDKIMKMQMSNAELDSAIKSADAVGNMSIGLLSMKDPMQQNAAYAQWLKSPVAEAISKQGVKLPEPGSLTPRTLQTMAAESSQYMQWLKLKASGTKEQEKFSAMEKIPGTQLYGQKSSKTKKYTNIRSDLDGTNSNSSSEFERNLAYSLKNKLITKKEHDTALLDRQDVFTGKIPEASLKERTRKAKMAEITAARDEYSDGVKHFSAINQSVSGALAAMEAGDNALSDALVTQVMSQVNDTDVKAFQMYREFDRSYGNVAERVGRAASKFLTGTRTEEEKKLMADTLIHFRDNYANRGFERMKDQHRKIAMENGQDPFKVVPPTSPEDIRDFPHTDRKEKIRLLKHYFPEVFIR